MHNCLMLWSVFASNSLISDGILVSKVVTGLVAVYAPSRKAMLDLQIHTLQYSLDMWSSHMCVCTFFVCKHFFLSYTFKIFCLNYPPHISSEMVYFLKCSIRGILLQWFNHCALYFYLRGFLTRKRIFPFSWQYSLAF